jgi:phage minor structural protein
MLSIMINGRFVHDPPLNDDSRLVLSPHLRVELNRPDVLTFTMPPNNILFGQVKKRKDTVSVYIDNEEVFFGQVIDERPSIYNTREYTCEGVLSFLADSVQRPLTITGDENLTAKAHFENLIANHNAQVSVTTKQFTVGTVDACEKVMQKEDIDYTNTLSAIEQQLVNRYGGFLRVRRENGINYIDWLKELTDVSTQAVEFGENIIDIDGLIDAREVGSALIPLGAKTKGKKLTIADVNNGRDYIESEALINKYGKVYITKDFPTIKDANELLEKAREALAAMEDDETFDITAVDLHALGVDVSALRVGLLTPIRAPRHGIDKSKILYAADMDLENIENTVYTFGVPRQTLTEALAETARGGGGVGKKIEELSDVITDAYIDIDAMKGDIELRAYQDEMNTRFSEAWIGINGVSARLDLKADEETVDELSRTVDQAYVLLDGANAAIQLKADKTYVEDLEKTVNQAQIDIDGANALISLKADTSTVNTLGERVSAAEVAIDGANSEISLKADKTYVDNLIAEKLTATSLAAEIAKIEKLSLQRVSGTIAEFSTVTADNVAFGGTQMYSRALSMGDIVTTNVLTSKGSAIDLAHSHAVTVNPDGTVTLGEVSATGGNFRIADTKAYKDGVSASYSSGYSAGWAAARAEVRRVNNSANKQVWVYGPGATVDSSARFYTIEFDVAITEHRNSAASTIFALAESNLKVNSSTAFTKTDDSTLTINAGML